MISTPKRHILCDAQVAHAVIPERIAASCRNGHIAIMLKAASRWGSNPHTAPTPKMINMLPRIGTLLPGLHLLGTGCTRTARFAHRAWRRYGKGAASTGAQPGGLERSLSREEGILPRCTETRHGTIADTYQHRALRRMRRGRTHRSGTAVPSRQKWPSGQSSRDEAFEQKYRASHRSTYDDPSRQYVPECTHCVAEE